MTNTRDWSTKFQINRRWNPDEIRVGKTDILCTVILLRYADRVSFIWVITSNVSFLPDCLRYENVEYELNQYYVFMETDNRQQRNTNCDLYKLLIKLF